MASTSMSRDFRRQARRALVITAIVYVVLRAWSLHSLPLILTNDSIGYVDWAQTILDKGMPAVDLETKPFRTPGFPLLLAALFKTFGFNPLGVQLGLRLFGCLGCLGVTWLVCRLAGPRLGTLAGILCCLDPGLFLFENFALSEVPAATLTVLLVATVAGPQRAALRLSPIVGLLLGAAILVKPAFQIFIPFTVAAWLIKSWPQGRRGITLHLIGLILGLCGILAPWVAVNKERYDTFRVARGSGAMLWYGIQRAGLLKIDQCPDDSVIREAYRPYEMQPLDDGRFRAFCHSIEGMDRRDPLLLRWAIRSILEDPPAYLQWFYNALKWQLNLYSPDMLNEMMWFFRHAAKDDSAVCYTIDAPQVNPLLRVIMSASSGMF